MNQIKGLAICLLLCLSGCDGGEDPMKQQYKAAMTDADAECAAKGGVDSLFAMGPSYGTIKYEAYCKDGHTKITKWINYEKY